jgi:uridine kinase
VEHPELGSANHGRSALPDIPEVRRSAVQIERSEAVAAVLSRLPSLSRTVWIGVDGKGASGKSTLAEEIAAAVPRAVLISIDDFARPDLTGWDRERFVAQVRQPLLAGRPAHYQRWDFATNRGADWRQVPTGVPVVVEGVSATDVRLEVPWDLTLWVEARPEVRLRRATERDGPEMLQRWLTDWIPSEDEYERTQHPQQRVDLIVHTVD